jgi:hypothetical protein
MLMLPLLEFLVCLQCFLKGELQRASILARQFPLRGRIESLQLRQVAEYRQGGSLVALVHSSGV